MGYATVCRMQDDDGRVVEERYLGANGYPVARYENFHGLSYEYDETSTVIIYLDVEGNPIIRSDGYSTIVRTQVDGRAYDDFFYDLNGQQVQCSGGYYGVHREYNAEGQNTSLTFLDKDDMQCVYHLDMRLRHTSVIRKEPLLANDTLTQKENL